jgi:hypothetical protein
MKMMKTTYILVLLVLLCACKSAEQAIKISQIISDQQITLRYAENRNVIYLIEFPFVFEYKNTSLKKRRIVGANYYYNNVVFGRTSSGEGSWNANVLLYYEIDKQLIRRDKMLPDKHYINMFEVHKIVVESGHPIDSSRVMQSHFQSYIERMRELNTDTLSIGTIQEFVQLHPQLAETLLKGDSISFNIRDKKGKWQATIDLPIKMK